MIHGSLETYAGPDAPTGAKRASPFTREEILASGYRWAALGHHHHHAVVEDETGAAVGAYAGCPTGRGLDEAGPRSFLKITLLPDGRNLLEKIPSDGRQVRDLSLDVTGLDAPRIREQAVSFLAAEGISSADLVKLTLRGGQPAGSRPTAALEDLPNGPASFLLLDRTTPETLLEPDERTAEGRFALDLSSRLARAGSERERRVLELALAVGRQALAGRAIVPPRLEEI